MAEKICTGGHVYLGEKCDRCGSVDPRIAQASAETAAPVESKSVSRRKAVQKAAPAKKVAKAKVAKVVKKTKKGKK